MAVPTAVPKGILTVATKSAPKKKRPPVRPHLTQTVADRIDFETTIKLMSIV